MLSALRRHWMLALLSALATFAGCVVALAAVPSSFTATSVAAMTPRPGSEARADLLLLTIPNYAALATSQATATELAAEYGRAPADIQDAIRVDNPPSSNTLLVSVSWQDPDTAAQLANSVTDVIVRSARTDPVLRAEVIADATAPSEASWPPWRGGLILGALLALTVGLLAARLAELRRQRLATPEQVARVFAERGVRAPLLLAASDIADTVPRFLAGVVDEAVSSRRNAGSTVVGVLVVGTVDAQQLASVSALAATLRERGRRVVVALDEHDPESIRRSHLRERRLTADRAAATGVMSLEELDGGPGRRKRAGLVLIVSDRPDRLADALDETSVGVVTMVMEEAPVLLLRAGIRVLRRQQVDHLAAVHWQRPVRSTDQAVSDAPSRPGSARAGAAPVLDRAPTSASDTSHSS
ncbi:hypothetical protein GCU60_00640 [Blastococcus saxobsidens]|uniref:Capsular polysaccharide biosynthesis protein n=1 Tax=Blastococcus saxobsidens TaxID=138336 RepID=A0A6L9VY05_9ACTN|nr:hypothetical protein [Blastococcus saxobsidens]NEK84284.1 hypothetical protein [Blastococcus saxobsidens]